MVFLWANIPFKLDTISLRYYNDSAWQFVFLLQNLKKRYIFSMIQMVPGFIVTLYQLHKHWNIPDHYHKISSQDWDQKVVKLLVIPVPLYYLLDAILSILEGTFYYDCRFWLWYHHMISIIVIPTLLIRNKYEWQDTLVMAFHSLLMKYPYIFEFSLIYVVIVLYFNVLLFISPLNEKKINRFLGITFPFIYYSFIVLLAYDCSNALPFLY